MFGSQNIQGFEFLAILGLANLWRHDEYQYYVKIPVFYFFEKVNKGQLKLINASYQKLPDFAVLSI